MSFVNIIIIKGSRIGVARVHVRDIQKCLDAEEVNWQELDAGYIVVDKNNELTINAQSGAVIRSPTQVLNI